MGLAFRKLAFELTKGLDSLLSWAIQRSPEGFVYHAHAAPTEKGLDLVVTQFGSIKPLDVYDDLLLN